MELEWVLAKCLRKEPGERYQDTRDLVVDLRQLTREMAPTTELPVRATEPAPVWRHRVHSTRIVSGFLLGAMLVTAWLLRGRRDESPQVVLRQLTDFPLEAGNQFVACSISPDGRYLAYLTSGEHAAVHLLHVDTGAIDRVPLDFPADYSPREGQAWFPDGTRMVVSAWQQEKGMEGSLWSLSLVDGVMHKLQDNANWPAVSPDGSRVAFRRRDQNDDNAIWLMDADGGTPRKVHGVKGLSHYSWSPDGRRFAYSKHVAEATPPTTSVESCNLQGGDIRELFADPRLDRRMLITWLRDGRIVYVRRERREPPPNRSSVNLWAIRVDPREGTSTSPERITNLPSVSGMIQSVSVDGKTLAADIWRALTDVYVGELHEGQLVPGSFRRLTLDEREDMLSDWMPDETTVLFSSKRRGTWDIYKQDVHSNVAEPIVAGPADESNPIPSPGGDYLLYKMRIDGASAEARVMRMPLAGGPSQRVVELRTDNSFFRCGRQTGASCVLAEWHEGVVTFSTFDPMLGRGNEIVRLDPAQLRLGWGWATVGWDLSADGSQLGIIVRDPAQAGDSVLRIIPVGEGDTLDVPLPPLLGAYTVTWTGAQDLLVSATVSEPGEKLILRIDVSGRTQTLIKGPHDLSYLWFPRVSSDGRYVAVTTYSFDGDVWLIEKY
jgi:Tol biopolymer transport system component